MNLNITHRPRRMRKSKSVRDLIQETTLDISQLVFPVFVKGEGNIPEKIDSMPEIYRWPINLLVPKILEWKELGLTSFAIFPQIHQNKKCDQGIEFLNPDSLVYQAAKEIKASVSDVILIGDLALDPYTSHGHDGVLSENGEINNDKTVEILSNGALLSADAGYDFLAPSDMMDGRISAIRKKLDQNNMIDTGIISYSAKFSSAYYGPFRDALGTGHKTPIDKSTYQLNPKNAREAKRELALDFEEGADILMVKPAEPYLDIINYAKSNFNIPVAAYQVSGEYSRIWAAHQNGWLNLELCALESLYSIKRAGADIIFSYFAEKLAFKI